MLDGVRTADRMGRFGGVRWMCDGIGLSKGQMQRQVTNIRSDKVLSKGSANLQLPTNGGNQEAPCLKLDFVPLRLTKISITPTMEREAPDLVERLMEYQLKAKLERYSARRWFLEIAGGVCR